jgi:ribosomal protein S18 acetylase RimI-like enzyme
VRFRTELRSLGSPRGSEGRPTDTPLSGRERRRTVAPVGELVDAAPFPGETARLLGARSAWFADRGWASFADPVASTLERIRTRESTASLWIGPKDEAIALVIWGRRGTTGREAELFLGEGYRQPAALRALLDRVEATPGPPIVGLEILGPDRTAREMAPLLEPRGYRWVDRRDMVFPADRPLPEFAEPVGTRGVTVADADALVALFADAYQDFPVDPAFFSAGGPPDAEVRANVGAIFDGTYGRSWSSASAGVERGGRLLAAVLVNDHRGPLIIEVAVARSARRQGLARALIVRAVRRLREEGAPAPRLIVTWPNVAARTLYTSLGFELAPLPESPSWAHFGRLGRREVETFLGPPLAPAGAP